MPHLLSIDADVVLTFLFVTFTYLGNNFLTLLRALPFDSLDILIPWRPRHSSSHARRRWWRHTPSHHLRRGTTNAMHRRRAQSDRCRSWCSGHRRRDSASAGTSRHTGPARGQPCPRRRWGWSLHGQANHILSPQDDQTQSTLLLPLFDHCRPISLLPEGAEFLRIGQDQVEMLVKCQKCADDYPAILQGHAEPMLHVTQEF